MQEQANSNQSWKIPETTVWLIFVSSLGGSKRVRESAWLESALISLRMILTEIELELTLEKNLELRIFVYNSAALASQKVNWEKREGFSNN